VPAAVKTPPRKLARTAVTISRRTHRTRRPQPAVWMQTAVFWAPKTAVCIQTAVWGVRGRSRGRGRRFRRCG
jgi:hypothetical protein